MHQLDVTQQTANWDVCGCHKKWSSHANFLSRQPGLVPGTSLTALIYFCPFLYALPPLAFLFLPQFELLRFWCRETQISRRRDACG